MRTLAPQAWRATRDSGPVDVGTSDAQLTAELRLALALITVIIAAGESTANPLMLPTAVGYLAYSAVVYVLGLGFRQERLPGNLAQYYPVDAGVFLLFMSLADARGTFASLFALYLFVFAVSGAATTWGLRAGLRLTMGAVGLFAALIPVRTSIASNLPVTETLLSLGCLLGVGTIAARRGGHQYTVRSHLILLRHAGTLANPRFGVDRTIDALLERLREFYDAETCVLTMSSALPAEVNSPHRADRYETRRNAPAAPLSLDALPRLPRTTLALYRQPRRWLPGSARVWFGERLNGRVVDCRLPGRLADIAPWLDQVGARSWLSVPAYADHRYVGRLHIVRERAFAPFDAGFALQLMESGMLLIENIRLVDQLASTAAVRERQRVARDIHDSVIQPYIGLQLGLAAVQRALQSGDVKAAEDNTLRLLGLTQTTIDDLRKRVQTMKAARTPSGYELLRAVRSHAAQFDQETGIRVKVEGEDGLECGDRLGAELFQMTVEALSNVRRHTDATSAAIRFTSDKHYVRLQIENQEPARERAMPFIPRSLSERTAALGGCITVDRSRNCSIVDIKIPL